MDAISRSTYASLLALVRKLYGGQITFNLPEKK